MNGKIILTILFLTVSLLPLRAQEKPLEWDLRTCIEYARQQNIQIRKSRIMLEENRESLKEAKSQRLPSLAFSSTQNSPILTDILVKFLLSIKVKIYCI